MLPSPPHHQFISNSLEVNISSPTHIMFKEGVKFSCGKCEKQFSKHQFIGADNEKKTVCKVSMDFVN